MNTPAYKVIRNIFANQLGFLVSIAVTFFLSPYVVHTLGDARYGIWSLIVSFTGHYGLLTFGIQGALTRYMAYASASEDHARMSGYLNTALYLLLLSAGLIVVAGIIIAFLLERIFIIPADLITEAKTASLLVAINAASTFATAGFHSVLVANQRFGIINGIGIVSSLVRVAFTVWLLERGYGIIGLAILAIGLTILTGIVQFHIVKKTYLGLKLSLRLASRSYLKELMDYGLKSFVIGIAVVLIYQCDLFVIGIYLPPGEITIYSLGATLVAYLVQWLNTIAFVFGPYATERYTKGGVGELSEFFIQGSCIMYMLAGLMVAGCLIFGEAFFTLWVGQRYTRSAAILTVLVVGQFFVAGGKVGGSLLVGMAKIGPLAIVAICEGVCNIVLSIILIRYMGILGVAVGTLLPHIFSNGIWLPLYVSRAINVKAGLIYMKSMFPGLIIVVTGLMIGYVVRIISIPVSWSAFTIDIFLMLFCCFLFSYVLLFQVKRELFWKTVFLRAIGIK